MRRSVRGAGVPVEAVIDALAGGASVERILERFPVLDERDIRACLAYAVATLRRERFVRRVRVGIAESKAGLGIPDEELDGFFGENDE